MSLARMSLGAGHFLSLAGGYWRGATAAGAWALTLGQALLIFIQVALAVRINLWSADLFNALERRSMDRFLEQLGIFALLVAGVMLSNAAHLELKRRMQIGWRRWLTEALLGAWVEDGRQYRLALTPGDHANPDGRIAEDIRIATEYAVDMANTLLAAAALLMSFLSILWTLSGALEFTFASHIVPVPGHMVALALLYAAAGGATASWLGKPLVRATDLRQGHEAAFRHGLVHVEDAGEAIALARAEGAERHRLVHLFDGIAAIWRRQTSSLRSLLLFSSGYATLAPMFPILVATPRFLAGDISLGGLMQTAQAFQQATSALSWPVDNAQRLAEWRASAERVLALAQALDTAAGPQESAIRRGIDGQHRLRLRAVLPQAPDGTPQSEAVTLELGRGQTLHLNGNPHAAGLLCRVIAGTWPWGSGEVTTPPGSTVLVTRQPYLAPVPLARLLATEAAPERLATALAQAGLAALVPRLAGTEDWAQHLTEAEQQRLSIARVLVQRPELLLLDHALDALDEAEAAQLLATCRAALPDSLFVIAGPLPPQAPASDREYAMTALTSQLA